MLEDQAVTSCRFLDKTLFVIVIIKEGKFFNQRNLTISNCLSRNGSKNQQKNFVKQTPNVIFFYKNEAFYRKLFCIKSRILHQ